MVAPTALFYSKQCPDRDILTIFSFIFSYMFSILFLVLFTNLLWYGYSSMFCLQYFTYSSVSWKGYILFLVALIWLLWLSCFILNSARVVIFFHFDLYGFPPIYLQYFTYSSDCWRGYVQIYSYLNLSIYFLCVYSVYMVSLPLTLSTIPILVFLRGSPLDVFLFWVSSSSISRSNFWRLLSLFVCLPVFQFSIFNFQFLIFNQIMFL